MNTIVIVTVVILVTLFGTLAVLTRFLRKVSQGRALIVNRLSQEPRVTFSMALVLPIVHSADELDITARVLTLECRGRDGLHSRDQYSVDIELSFVVRVNKTADDVLRVASSVGAARAGDLAVIRQLFLPKFAEATASVVCALDFEQLRTERQAVRDQILQVIGMDLDGFVLDDVAIADIRLTPIENLDPNDLPDAQAIRKLTEQTAREQVRTSELVRATEMRRARQAQVRADEPSSPASDAADPDDDRLTRFRVSDD